MRVRKVWAASGLAALLALAACGSSGSASSSPSSPPAQGGQSASVPSGSTIAIGVIERTTGVDSEAYVGTAPAATAWEKWVNANGGINGHPVKVYLEDGGADGAKGLSAAKDLVENKHVLAIVPDNASTDTAIVSYTTGQGIPVISPYAAYPIWNQTPGWFALGIQSSPESQQAAAKIISDSGAKSLAAVVCAEVAACGAVDAVLSKSAPADGLRYDGVLKVAASSPSYTAQCLALKGKETQVLYMGVSSGVSLKLASDCATQDYTPEFFFPYHAFQPALTKIQGLNALAMLPTLPWYADVPATKDFRSAMSQYADLSKADETSMYAWVGLEAFRAAAAKAGATPTKQSVMAAMYQLKDYNAGGLIAPVSFTQGQPSPYVKCYFVAGYSDGKFTTPQGTDPKCLS